jgi:hypothetical protein
MKTRGKKIKLKHNDTGQVLNLVVILADSKQGYLASTPDNEWSWYPIDEWSEVK